MHLANKPIRGMAGAAPPPVTSLVGDGARIALGVIADRTWNHSAFFWNCLAYEVVLFVFYV
jgi:hypothetical protein